MLQELLIVLAILAGIVWLGVKLFGAFFNALIDLQTSYGRALARFEAKRSARKKAFFAPHVQIIQPLNQSERKELVPKVHPAIMLRVAYELFRNDLTETIKILALNGWVSFIEISAGILIDVPIRYTGFQILTQDIGHCDCRFSKVSRPS